MHARGWVVVVSGCLTLSLFHALRRKASRDHAMAWLLLACAVLEVPRLAGGVAVLLGVFAVTALQTPFLQSLVDLAL